MNKYIYYTKGIMFGLIKWAFQLCCNVINKKTFSNPQSCYATPNRIINKDDES